MAKIAVLLSGCGVFDGAEIHEAVLTLLHLARAGAEVSCFAPDIDQAHVINHRTGEEMPESRNVLTEAARISRGDIAPVTDLKAAHFDALILPGGFGAAKNLSDFAFKGADATVQKDVAVALKDFAQAQKPVGYICISPALIPLIYGAGAKATIGTDKDTEAAILQMGGEHCPCRVDEILVDEAHKIVSTPAYMLAENILEADQGISKLVTKILEMIK